MRLVPDHDVYRLFRVLQTEVFFYYTAVTDTWTIYFTKLWYLGSMHIGTVLSEACCIFRRKPF